MGIGVEVAVGVGVASGVAVGEGEKVGMGSGVGVFVGDEVCVAVSSGVGVFVGKGVFVGRGVYVGNGVYVGRGVYVGSGVGNLVGIVTAAVMGVAVGSGSGSPHAASTSNTMANRKKTRPTRCPLVADMSVAIQNTYTAEAGYHRPRGGVEGLQPTFTWSMARVWLTLGSVWQ